MSAILQTPPQKSNIFLFLIPVVLLLLMFGVLMALLLHPTTLPPPPTAPNWLAENSATEVRLLPGRPSQIYAFNASPTESTLLSLEAGAPGFAFAAQVKDETGEVVAQFDSRVEVAALSLAPRVGSYQLMLSSLHSNSIGSVNVAIGAAAAAQSNPPAAILSKAAPPCQVTTASALSALVRSAPATDYEVLTTLASGSYLTVLGITDDGWYAVNLNERMSWMQRDVATLVGTCDVIPRLLNPIIPVAPSDPEVYMVEVDRDSTGQLRDAISLPQGDASDLVWVRAINLYNFAPNNYREFSVTVNCTGVGAEHLRWGSPFDPTLRCGETFNLPFLYEISQQPIAIVFAANSPQSYVEYNVTIVSNTAQPPPSLVVDETGAVG
jgi:hypothetical protein